MGRLASAAERVGEGDLDVQVIEERTGDEIEELGRLFNRMTRQLKGQRDRLLDNTDQIERRRRLFNSVLSSVTAGVMGLDADGQVAFLNRAARVMLGIDEEAEHPELALVVPEFAPLLDRLRAERGRAGAGGTGAEPHGPPGTAAGAHGARGSPATASSKAT